MFGRSATGVRGIGPAMRSHRRSAMTMFPAVRRRGEWLAVAGARFAASAMAAMAGLDRRDRALRFGHRHRHSRRTGGEPGDGFRT